ncbi:CotH kinase family protein [Bacteroidota bacterium]
MKKLAISILLAILFISLKTLNAQQLKADPPVIETKGGFFYDPIDVTINTNILGDTIKYTLDGSNPQTSNTSITEVTPVVLHIDPDSIERPNTPGVVLRTCAIKNGFQSSYVVSSTYIYINEVRNQTYPGGDWPEFPINNQVIDYDMDPDIINDSRYTDQIETALLDIPSISIVTDIENLFDPDSGIYVNASFHGREWERPASVELIKPDNSEGFNINAGLRIRGGYSRSPENPKHAFRLFFRSEYGAAKLHYPLFEDEGVSEFDKIDLRTSQNFSWSFYNDPHNTMNRDVFSRDLQKEMGQPYTRSRYYHLYLNGMYWGLFQSQERPEARFAESYFGGNLEDYDVVKVNSSNSEEDKGLEATDGNLDKWRQVWDILQNGFEDDENYFKLEGKNKNGQNDSSIEVLVNIDNLIDYMMIIFYTGNFDSPVAKWEQNKTPKNFYIIKNRMDGREGFKFFIHDAENSLLANSWMMGEGVNENRVNIGNRDDEYKMVVSSFNKFHPQWLHFKLSDNEKYRLRFADRAYTYLYNNGILTPEYCEQIFRSSADKINMAIIAESARWGDAGPGKNRTKDDDWLPEINTIINIFISQRTDIVKGQLKNENLLPQLSALPYMKNDDLNSILVYPNPTNGLINIFNRSDNAISYIELLNISGEQILSLSNSNKMLSVDLGSLNLQNGMYILRITSKNDITNHKIFFQL